MPTCGDCYLRNMVQNKANSTTFTSWCHYTMHATTAESNHHHQEQINMVFANCSKENVIYPLTVKEIAQAQKDDTVLKKLHKHNKYSTQLVDDTQSLCKGGKMVIPTVLQNQSVCWYHHYLQHPGHTHLEETLHSAIDHMSKTFVHVKLTNNTSTSIGNSLENSSSQTLGRHCVYTLLGLTLTKVKMGQKMTLCVLL